MEQIFVIVLPNDLPIKQRYKQIFHSPKSKYRYWHGSIGTDLPVGGIIPSWLWLGGLMVGAGDCPTCESACGSGAAVETIKY